MPEQTTTITSRGLDLAAEHLERRDYEIVAREAKTRFGTIDLVAFGHGALVFAEVVTRRATGGPTPLTPIDHRKVRQVRKLAAAWLNDTPERPSADDIRFDAIGVTVDGDGRCVTLDHLECAF